MAALDERPRFGGNRAACRPGKVAPWAWGRPGAWAGAGGAGLGDPSARERYLESLSSCCCKKARGGNSPPSLRRQQRVLGADPGGGGRGRKEAGLPGPWAGGEGAPP